jgi:hypothetical protein
VCNRACNTLAYTDLFQIYVDSLSVHEVPESEELHIV